MTPMNDILKTLAQGLNVYGASVAGTVGPGRRAWPVGEVLVALTATTRTPTLRNLRGRSSPTLVL